MPTANILQVPGFIEESRCQRLIAIFERFAPMATRCDYTGNPVVYLSDDFLDEDSRREIGDVASKCQDAVEGRFGRVCQETIVLAMLPPGGFHPPHADNCKCDDAGEWVPNHTHERQVSALVYLNDDFEGGEIVFGPLNVTIKPTAGLLLAFPSGHEHFHEVLAVTHGRRYSLPVWFVSEATPASGD